MKSILILILTFSSNGLIGQDLLVVKSKDTYYLNRQKVNPKDLVLPGTKIKIEKKGFLSINYKNRWTLYLRTGVHDIDSALRLELAKPEFKLQDSIYSILEKKGLHDCKFKYKYEPILDGPAHGVQRVDDIKINRSSRLITSADTIELIWTHPTDYSKNYYLIIMNMFSEYIGIMELKTNKVNLDLRPFKAKKKILYKLLAEDCRESSENMITME
jgi:hypothetical protein